MKRVSVTLLLLITISAFAQKGASASREQVQKQLLTIEDEIARANNTCDYDYFRKIEAEEFIFTDSQGGITTRQEDLAGEKDCKPYDDTRLIDEPRVLLFGDTAVVSARSTVSGQRNGKEFRSQSRFTDVFAWRDGRWQLVAGHSSRIPSKPQ